MFCFKGMNYYIVYVHSVSGVLIVHANPRLNLLFCANDSFFCLVRDVNCVWLCSDPHTAMIRVLDQCSCNGLNL